jgi:beta-mannosidase
MNIPPPPSASIDPAYIRWRLRDASRLPAQYTPWAGRLRAGIRGSLPGSIHAALLAHGIIPDPLFGFNVRNLEWIEQQHWTLDIEFLAAGHLPTSDTRLILEGVDTFAAVSVNGTQIGHTRNAFLRYSFPVGTLLRSGVNCLSLEFLPVLDALGTGIRAFSAAFSDPHRVHVRRPQCTFGWDWVHRFVSFGLAREPGLVCGPALAFPSVLVREASPEEATLEARWELEGDGLMADALLDFQLSGPDGIPVYQALLPVRQGVHAFRIPRPALWYPAGSGEQPLYTAAFTLPGNPARHQSVGIRRIELLEPEDPPAGPLAEQTLALARATGTPPARGRGFSFRINGADVFALGGNWVPCDPFPGTDVAARQQAILESLVRAGGNCIRVWGGGLYEPDEFYDTCDRLGILVLQDFMMACGVYPHEDPAFLSNYGPEASQQVKRLRHHASIVLWYGDNENAWTDGESAPGKAWFEIFEGLTRPAIEQHDGTRPFKPSSPFGGTPSTNPLQGDCHLSAYWSDDRKFYYSDMRDYKRRAGRLIGRFMSECGAFGAPDLESLRRFLPEDALGDRDAWDFHTKDNPHKEEWIKETLYDHLDQTARTLFGDFTDPGDRLRKLAYTGHELVRHTVEAARRRQPFCRGLLFWMLNDCWPASGWSLVDFYTRPKASLHGLQHAAQPVHCSFREMDDGTVEVWGLNSTQAPVAPGVHIVFERWDGSRLILAEIHDTFPAGGSVLLAAFDPRTVENPQGGVFRALLPGAAAPSWYFHGMPFEMRPTASELAVRSFPGTAGSIEVEVTARATYARAVTFHGPFLPSANWLELGAGETRRVLLVPQEGAPPVPASVDAWNAPAIPIPLL